MPLQRCHIIPRSLGGSDEVSNLFLMCRECHDLAPNTPFPELFFEWMRKQSWHSREEAKMRAALESFGIDDASREDFFEALESNEFKLWVSGKLGIHRPQSKYAPFSSRLTPSTMVGLVVHYQRTRKDTHVLDTAYQNSFLFPGRDGYLGRVT